jgi:hypothetical protein
MNTREAKRSYEKSVAECVVSSLPNVTLVTMRESPDADLLHADGFHIGLEIVETVDPRPLHLGKRLQAASDAIRGALEAEGQAGAYWIYYDLDEMGENIRQWNRDVPRRLAKFLRDANLRRVEAAELQAQAIPGVASIEIEPGDQTFVGVGWRTVTAVGNTLADIALASKDAKLTKYRQNNAGHFQEYWLAIASFGPGTAEDGGFSLLWDRSFRTAFDRVFLLVHGTNGQLARAEDVTPATSLLRRADRQD